MVSTIQIVDGWTERIDFQLLADGVVINLTSKTVTAVVRDRNNALVTLSNPADVFDPTNGKVGLVPASGDLQSSRSPFQVRFEIAPDGYFVPNGAPGFIAVAPS